MTITPVERRRLSDDVVEQVTQLIRSGAYTTGMRLPSERELAKGMGVSRTLVRESFRILESIGFVDVRPGVGAIVARQNSTNADVANYLFAHAAEVLEVVEVRESLAIRAAELAAKRMTDDELRRLAAIYDAQRHALASVNVEHLIQLDDEFHDLIYRGARNNVLIAMEEYARGVLDNVRWNALTLTARRAKSLDEHERLLRALTAHDARAAASAARIHIRRANAAILKVIDAA
jgi:GntR family transcriptional repressor for pyruvate dehydrogenase complex